MRDVSKNKPKTAKRLTVYGGWVIAPSGWPGRSRQAQCVVAASSQAEAARLADVTISHVRNYWSVTANPQDVEQAMSEPRTVWLREMDFGRRRDWHRLSEFVDVAERQAERQRQRIESLALRQRHQQMRLEARERDVAMRKATLDWMEHLAEVGVVADPPKWMSDHLRVFVNPERLYGQIVETLALLREAGIEDHPFQPLTQGETP